MQPYLFPYLGYFQLINAVDKFVVYDDVNFIKRGWINRNRILAGNIDVSFSVPLTKASQNITINKTYINEEMFETWKSKFLQTLKHSYKKAPNFNDINNLVISILDKEYRTISELAIESVVNISKYLELEIEFSLSSVEYRHNKGLAKGERLIDICKNENASDYINALGGQELYKKEDFRQQNIQLNFLKSNYIEYKQFKNEFVPWLSIIDVMMFNTKEEVKDMLNDYSLI